MWGFRYGDSAQSQPSAPKEKNGIPSQVHDAAIQIGILCFGFKNTLLVSTVYMLQLVTQTEFITLFCIARRKKIKANTLLYFDFNYVMLIEKYSQATCFPEAISHRKKDSAFKCAVFETLVE